MPRERGVPPKIFRLAVRNTVGADFSAGAQFCLNREAGMKCRSRTGVVGRLRAGRDRRAGTVTVATTTYEGSSLGARTHRARLDLEDHARKLVAPRFLDSQIRT